MQMPPTLPDSPAMSAAPRIAVAVEVLLQRLFHLAQDRKLTTVTVEHMLALLVGEPGVCAFLGANLPQENQAALRAELYLMLDRQPTPQAAPRRSWPDGLKTLKPLARFMLPRGIRRLDQWLDDAPRFSDDATHVLMRAILRVPPPGVVQDTDLLLSIIENSSGPASALLARHAVSRYALLCHVTNARYPRPVAAHPELQDEAAKVRLFLLNDDFSPMEFVVDVLQTVFSKSPQEANALMLEIHHSGRAACGIFSPDAAKQKLRQLEQLAAGQQHPLRAVLEAVDQDDALMA